MPPKNSVPDSTDVPEPESEGRSPIDREFWCFISYRRTDNEESGREWATWLQQQLETYEIPPDLVGTLNERGQEIPAQIFPVFRDEDELAAGELDQDITGALSASKTLVVVCSPRITQSRYCADEIRFFKSLRLAQATNDSDMKRPRPFLVVIAGDPFADENSEDNCFPDAVRYAVNQDGDLTDTPAPESLWLDMRLPDGSEGWASKEAYRRALADSGVRSAEIQPQVEKYAEKLDNGRLRLIAGILGVPLGELTRRDKAYQLRKARRRQRLTAILASVFLVLAVAAIIAGVIAVRKEKETRATLAQSDFAAGMRESNEKNTPEALAYFARALRNDPQHRVARAHVENLLRERWWVTPIRSAPLPTEIGNVVDAEFFDETAVAVLSRGMDRDAGKDGDTLWLLDLGTGKAQAIIKPESNDDLMDLGKIEPGNEIRITRYRADEDRHDLSVIDRNGDVKWQSPAIESDQLSLSGDGKWAALIEQAGTRIIDTQNKTSKLLPAEASTVQLSRDGSRALLTLNQKNTRVVATDSGQILDFVEAPRLVSNDQTSQLSPLGTAFTYLTRDHRFYLRDLRNEYSGSEALQHFEFSHFFPLDKVAFSNSNEFLLTSGGERIDYTELNLYDSQGGEGIYRRLIPESEAIASLAFDKKRNLALAVPNGVWSFLLPAERAAEALIVHEPVRTNGRPRAVAFSPTGQLLSIADSQIDLWKMPEGPGGDKSERREIEWDGLLEFLSETDLLILKDGKVCTYNLDSGDVHTTEIAVADPQSISDSIAPRMDRSGGRLLMAPVIDNEMKIEIWDLATETLVNSIPVPYSPLQGEEGYPVICGGGNLIIEGRASTIGEDGQLQPLGNFDRVTAISDDGRFVHRLGDSGSEVWDVTRNRIVGSRPESLNDVVFDAHGSTLLCRHQDQSIRLWPIDLSDPLSPPIRLGVDELLPYAVSEDFLVLRVERRVGRRHRARGFAVFDTRSFEPVSKPVFEEISNCTLLLSPQHGTVVEWYEEMPLRLVPLFRVDDRDRDDWLPDVAEAIGGLRIDLNNVFQIVPTDTRKKTLETHSAAMQLETRLNFGKSSIQ